MPSWLQPQDPIHAWQLGTLGGAALVGLLVYGLGSRAAAAWARRTDTDVDDSALALVRPPARLLLPVGAVTLSWPLDDATAAYAGAHQALVVLTIAAMGWLLVRVVRATELVLSHHFTRNAEDTLHGRAVQTQLHGFGNIAVFLVAMTALASALMTFETVREIGVSLFASAGVAGIVLGFAAQRSIATLVAGVQIALTQPIRVDDVVIVEGEWGTIEEITLTYVVVRIWDERRLVVPIGQFIEKPFQNWTRNSSELLGTVFVYTDYGIPIEALREQLGHICKAAPDWDGRVCTLVVTDSKPHVLELRALVSAADAGKLWGLRCHVREALVQHIQQHYPHCLPRFRAEVQGAGDALPGV